VARRRCLAARRLHSCAIALLIRRPLEPTLSASSELVTHLGPVVQSGRVEVGTVWPDERSRLGVEPDFVEHRHVLQGPEECAVQYWREIDTLRRAVAERDQERIRTDNVEAADPMDGMTHGLPEWLDLDWRPARLQEIPVLLQFHAVDFSPRFHETPLCEWEATAQALDRIHREDSSVVLIVRVEMCPVVCRAGLNEHPDDDPKEPR